MMDIITARRRASMGIAVALLIPVLTPLIAGFEARSMLAAPPELFW